MRVRPPAHRHAAIDGDRQYEPAGVVSVFPDEVDAAGGQDRRGCAHHACEIYRDLLYTNVELVIWKVPTEGRLSGDSSRFDRGRDRSEEKEERWQQTGTTTSARNSGSSRGGASSAAQAGGCSHTALRRPGRDPERAGSERGDLQAQQRQRDLRQPPEVQVRDGQPRDDELVLHGDDLRNPGCMCPDRLLVSVDRLGDLDRLPDGLGVQHRDRREGERHRVLPDRQHRLQQARRHGARPRHPRDRLQRRRLGGRPEQPAGLRRPEQPDRRSGGRERRSSRPVSRRAISLPGSSRRRERGTSSRGSTARSRS